MSASAETSLDAEWGRCRWVWNECVATSRRAHLAGEECGPARLGRMLTGWRGAHEWLGAGASAPQQQTVRAFGQARAKALMDVKSRAPMSRRRGMPRFKLRHRARPTLNYTRPAFRIKDNRLLLVGGISLTVVWSRPLPGIPSSVRIYRDTLGHWYASFAVEAVVQPLPSTGRSIGVDWGVREIATTSSDAYDLPHPEYGAKAVAALAHRQRAMARRRPEPGGSASRSYLAVRSQVAKLHKKVARQRRDTARKWAKRLVREFDSLAVEDFRPKFLASSMLARKAADAAITTTKAELIHMARKHCRDLRLVNPANTTADCSRCGARAKPAPTLSDRTYDCSHCGYTGARDKNSALVMLVRAGFDPAGAEGGRPDRPPADQAA
ncbi:transposase [Glycomyces sp. NPDC046736]|uniref:RNA-guided endonuclease InsQ/TnpB family protein n=1 Tax=Glycomyces sp. NPDC046736 TaxID=3155615 RepID=UPI0033E33CE6